MTDSSTEPEQGKRERLVAGARELIHQQGVEKTTIADIARVADVPVGNVYYYFKTKDELVDAAIDGHTQDVHAVLGSLERHRTPQARLKALFRALTDQRELAAHYGCPLGSLCSELDKRTDGLDQTGSQLLRLPIDWAEQQFRLDGTARRPRPRRRADRLLRGNRSAHQHVPRPGAHDPRGTPPRALDRLTRLIGH